VCDLARREDLSRLGFMGMKVIPHLSETTTAPTGGSIDSNQCSVARVVVNVLSNVYMTTSSEVFVTDRGVNLMQ